MALPSLPYVFSNGTTSNADQLTGGSGNFDAVIDALTDGTKSVIVDSIQANGVLQVVGSAVVQGDVEIGGRVSACSSAHVVDTFSVSGGVQFGGAVEGINCSGRGSFTSSLHAVETFSVSGVAQFGGAVSFVSHTAIPPMYAEYEQTTTAVSFPTAACNASAVLKFASLVTDPYGIYNAATGQITIPASGSGWWGTTVSIYASWATAALQAYYFQQYSGTVGTGTAGDIFGYKMIQTATAHREEIGGTVFNYLNGGSGQFIAMVNATVTASSAVSTGMNRIKIFRVGP